MPSEIINVNAVEALKLVGSETGFLVDVREQGEYDEAHIPGALLVPLSEFDSKKSTIEVSDKIAIFHCRSGGRTESYKQIFAELGFKKIALLDGGIIGWEKAGGEIKKSQPI